MDLFSSKSVLVCKSEGERGGGVDLGMCARKSNFQQRSRVNLTHFFPALSPVFGENSILHCLKLLNFALTIHPVLAKCKTSIVKTQNLVLVNMYLYSQYMRVSHN